MSVLHQGTNFDSFMELIDSYMKETGTNGGLSWIQEIGHRWNAIEFEEAAREGKLELIKFMRKNGGRWDKDVLSSAVAGGDLDTIKWLILNRSPCYRLRVIPIAAFYGHLEVIKYLRSTGFPWGIQTMTEANEGRHEEIINWLRNNGCPQDKFLHPS